jgi:hypothetical protein
MLRKVVLGFLLLAGLASVGGCLPPAEQSTPVPAAVTVSPKATASLADPASAPVTADPPLTATHTQPPVVSTVEPAVEIVTATPCDSCPDKEQPTATDTPTPALPIAPVPGAQAPDFTLTDLNGDKVTLSGLRGQAVLLNFWATW